MSKKRNKSPANNAGNTNKWESNIVSAALNETNWTYSLSFLVENIPEDTETLDYINTGILTGLRKRFTLITKEKINNLITEFGNPKLKKGKDAPVNYEICESGKLCLDKGEELPVSLLARFIKWIILSNKTEDLRQLNNLNKKNDGKSSKGKKPTEKTERVKSSGGKKGPQASGKRSPEPPSVKQDSKLRKRGDPDPDIQYIDDEPDDGSSRYFIVSGLVDCQLLEALTEIGCVATSIIKITRDIHIPIEKIDSNENVPENESGDSLKDIDNIESAYECHLNSLNDFWSDLNNILSNNKYLMNTPVITFVAKHLMFPIEKDNEELKTKCSMDLFEALAVLKYDLLDLKRQWKNYLSKSKLINLPSKSVPIICNENTPRESMKEEIDPLKINEELSSDVTFDKIDLDYYNYLLQDIALESTSIYMQMSAMLDQVEITCGEKSPDWNLNKSDQPNETNEKMMDLLRTMTEKIYFPKNDLLDLQETLKQSKSEKDLNKDHENNVPIHALDSITLRDREINADHFGKNGVLEQELRMLITSFRHLKLINIVPVDEKIGRKRIGRLQELLKYLDNTGLSSKEINYAIKMFIMENVTLSGVDENGFIRTNNEDGIFQRNIHPVWDDPYMIIDEVSQSIIEDEINLSKKELYTQEREHTSFLISEFTSSSLKSDHNSDGILKSSRLSSRSQSPEQAKPTRRKSSVRFVDEESENYPTRASETRHDIMAMLRDQDENFFQNLLIDYLSNIRKRDLNEWCFEEFYEPQVLLQIIHNAIYKLPFVDIYNQRQMDGQIVVLHNPFQSDSKLNQQPWDQWLHSNVGFRNYLDYVNDKITDWIRDEEAIYQASLLSKELQNIEVDIKEPETRGRPNKIEEKSKQKNSSRSRSSTGASSENEDSNKEFTLILPGSLKAQKLEQDKINKAKEEEELKKEQKQQLSARKKAEKEIVKDGDKAKDSKRPSSKDSNKSKIKKTAFEDSTESFEKENIPESNDNQPEETYWPFISYNLGDNLAHFSGNVSHLFPCDGSTIRIFKSQKLLDSTSIRVSAITTQSHVFTVHIIDPSYVQNPEIDNYQKVLDYFGNTKTLCRYGASTCTFNDGIIITSSNNGYNGTIDKIENPQISSASCGNENISQRSAEQITTENQMTSSQDTSGDIVDANCKSPQKKSKFKNQMELSDIPSILLSIPNGVQVKMGYELTDKNKIGRQLLVFMSKTNVTKMKTNSSENMLNTILETGRYITSDGCVISIYDNDSIKVMFPDGTVAVSKLLLKSVTITIQETEEAKLEKSSVKESPTQKKRTKQSKPTISLEQQNPNNTSVTEELKQKTNYFRKWTVTLPNGEIFETVADLNSLFATKSSMISNETVNETETMNGEKKACSTEIPEITETKNYFSQHLIMEPLLVSTATDPFTGETLVTRSDGTLLLVSKDAGIFLSEHSDGTRFTKYFIIEKFPNTNHGSEDVNKSRITEFLLIESKQYPSITIDITHGRTEIRLGSMGILLSDLTGQHVFKHSDNTEIEYRPDGEIIFTASNNAQMTYLQPGGPCSYVFNTTSNILCEIVDNEGTEFSVDVNGDYMVKTVTKNEKQSREPTEDGELDPDPDKFRPCSSAISMTNDTNGNIRKYDQHAPRFFSINSDGTGSELLRYRDIVDILVNAEIEEDYLHYKEEIQDSPQIIAHTILHPDCKNKPWEYEYSRKTVLPKGLTCRDLKSFPSKETVVEGPEFAMKVGRGLEIFSNPVQFEPDKKQVKHSNRDLWLNPMQFRQFYHYPVITNDIRNNCSTQLVDYNKKILIQRQHYNNLELLDDRNNEEKMLANETKKRFEAMQHGHKQTINNAINNLSEKNEKANETTNIQQVEKKENTRPALNRRKLDILLEQKQLNQEKEIEDKLALRTKTVPKYFTSIYGKEFISNQAMDLQSLNKSMQLFSLSRNGTSTSNFEVEKMQQKNKNSETFEEPIQANSVSRDLSSSVAEPVLTETHGSKSTEKDSKLVFRKKEKKYVYYDSDLFIPTALKKTSVASDLNLPRYLYSQRPAIEPNIRQAVVEDPVRRKVYTTSLIGGSNTSQVFQRQTRGINVLPARIHTGLLREDQNYQYQLKLINTGPESSYFKIKQPASSTGIWVEFLPGPIAAGLSRKITIHIYPLANDPVNNDSDVFLLEHSLEITTNTDKLIIPIVGRIMKATKYDSTHHSLSSNVTDLPTVVDQIPKDYVTSQVSNVVP